MFCKGMLLLLVSINQER